MSIFFLDSSALVKRYVPETGTNWILSLSSTTSGNNIFISQITPVELISALARQYHDKEIKLPIFQAFRQLLMLHTQNQYQVLTLSNSIVLKAFDLHETHRLRAYDSIQLATAIELQARLSTGGRTLDFISADVRLLQAASSGGLSTDNPNNYP
jgi:uncharacterized protein